MALESVGYYFATAYEADPALMGAITGRDEEHIQKYSRPALVGNVALRCIDPEAISQAANWRFGGKSAEDVIQERWRATPLSGETLGTDDESLEAEIREANANFVVTTLVPRFGESTEGRLLQVDKEDLVLLANWRMNSKLTDKVKLRVAIFDKVVRKPGLSAWTFNTAGSWLTPRRSTRPNEVDTRRHSFEASRFMIESAQRQREELLFIPPGQDVVRPEES